MKIQIRSVSHNPEIEAEVFAVRLLLDADEGHDGVFMGEVTVAIPFDSNLTFSQIEQQAIAEAKRVL
ncbi:hypothetical protein HK44_007915 [Pseudomonas fluorescens HK44]|uniref:Uncharacterized protein n=1 Tax=Pseudomonas fluorescens HK44 TaxID=1042209 RepID=A0A010RNP9_PSEFL|nr:hypothetical protein [Pseudomonas fluorescens]EXF94126.1 hypothetical protein HK44_007915 [Pseudomonas fluorescens HK44]